MTAEFRPPIQEKPQPESAMRTHVKMTTQPPSPPATAPRNRWAGLAFTIIPFFVYQLAQRIPLPIDASLEGVIESPEVFNVVALGILPWIIAALIVEGMAFVVPRWRHLRHGVSGRAKLYWAANIMGLLIVAFEAYTIARLLASQATIVNANSWEFYAPYLTKTEPSPMPVFAALVAGTIVVKLLADLVNRCGLTHGYVMFWAGELLLSTLRAIIRDARSPEWMDILKLSGSGLTCALLTLSILMKLRPARRATKYDKPEDTRILIEDGDLKNPYAPPRQW